MAVNKDVRITGRIKAWSFSRWWDYHVCPFKAGMKHVMKRKVAGNVQMQRGSDIHKLGEDYVKGGLKRLPAEYRNFSTALKDLKIRKAATELEWAFTAKHEPTSWFGDDAWLRIKVDAFASEYPPGKKLRNAGPLRAKVVDYKTGRQASHHSLQIDLYAMGAFWMYPELEEVDSELWYLDSAEEDSRTFKRKQLPSIEKAWMARVKPMLADTTFRPKANSTCGYCEFASSKGGPCPLK